MKNLTKNNQKLNTISKMAQNLDFPYIYVCGL